MQSNHMETRSSVTIAEVAWKSGKTPAVSEERSSRLCDLDGSSPHKGERCALTRRRPEK